MQHHEVIQGSPEWDVLRLGHKNASEAPVVMGCQPNMKRDELLEAKATQTPKEFSSFVIDVVFAKGHETEAMARPLVEEMIGEELFPVTGSNGEYLASFDGLNMLDTIGFEHKQWNVELAAMVKDGRLPNFIRWQLEHQFIVCDSLQKIIFVVSDGTPNNFVHVEYVSDPEYRNRLGVGWQLFRDDLLKFKPTEKKAEVIGLAPESLPTLVVDIEGQLTTKSNLEIFKTKSLALISGIKKELVTDQDFANAATTVKYLDAAEKRIDLVKEQLLAKTVSLGEAFTTMDNVKGLMRTARLQLNKQVEADKKNRKNNIVQTGMAEVNEYIVQANKEFEEQNIQVIGICTDLYGCIKGMSSFDNMQSAVNDEVARFKIECSQRATTARNALVILNDMATDHLFLFPNLQDLVFMEVSHLKLHIESKINSYKEEAQAAEQKEIARRKSVIQNFNDYAEKADSGNLNVLMTTKSIIEAISTDNLGDSTEEAEQAKTAAIAAFDKQIADVNADLAADKVVEEAAADTQQQASSQVENQEVATQEPASHDEALPGHDDLDTAPTYKVTVTAKDLRDAILTVLAGTLLGDGVSRGDDGLEFAILNGQPPEFETAKHWAETLRKVV